MMPRSRQLSALLVLFCTALALAAASCSDDDDPTRPQPTTTAPDTTQPQPETETDEQALQALAEDWFEIAPSLLQPEGDLALAAEYLVDPYLGEVEAQAEEYRSQGVEVQVSDRSGQEIESLQIEGDTAVIVECVVDGDLLVDSDSGEVLNDSVAAIRTSTKAVATDQGWRLSERTTTDEFEGQDTCAE